MVTHSITTHTTTSKTNAVLNFFVDFGRGLKAVGLDALGGGGDIKLRGMIEKDQSSNLSAKSSAASMDTLQALRVLRRQRASLTSPLC
jgi:hypothetical protein